MASVCWGAELAACAYVGRRDVCRSRGQKELNSNAECGRGRTSENEGRRQTKGKQTGKQGQETLGRPISADLHYESEIRLLLQRSLLLLVQTQTFM